MLRMTLETWGLTLVVGVLGAVLGFGIELVVGASGWALVGASIGLCAGAMLAGARATSGPSAPPARAQPPARTE
jgi:F0F1-type ATP synthase assembly protein I